MRLTHSDNLDVFINMKPVLCLINIHIIFFLAFLALCVLHLLTCGKFFHFTAVCNREAFKTVTQDIK